MLQLVRAATPSATRGSPPQGRAYYQGLGEVYQRATLVLLRRAAQRISQAPETLCQGSYARDARGVPTWPGRAHACCAIGHTLWAWNRRKDPAGYSQRGAVALLDLAAQTLYGAEMSAVNDNQGHAAVVRCYQLAQAIGRELLRPGPGAEDVLYAVVGQFDP